MASDSPRDINRRMNELRLELYPELESEDLVAFMRRLLVAGGYSLEGVDGRTLGDRSARVSCAGLERLFIVSLWCKGVSFGAGDTPDALVAAQAIGSFVLDRWSVDAMAERFPFFRFHESARAHELGRFLDHVVCTTRARSKSCSSRSFGLVRRGRARGRGPAFDGTKDDLRR